MDCPCWSWLVFPCVSIEGDELHYTEADAFVDVEPSGADAVEAGGEAAAAGPEGEPAEAGEHHLAAVRVAAEHQVAALAAQPFDREGVVRQHDARQVGGDAGQARFGI